MKVKDIVYFITENVINEINDVYSNDEYRDNDPILRKTWNNGFRLDEMLKSDDLYDRINYCKNKLRCIGGSGIRRIVFELDDNFVLKITRGDHRYQSKNEYDTYFLMSGKYPLLFPKIIYQSPDFSFAVIEKVRPFKEEDSENILGIPLRGKSKNEPSLVGFQQWAETQARKSKQDKSVYNAVVKSNCESIYRDLSKNNEWFKELLSLEHHQSNDLNYGTDLNSDGFFRTDNLGVVERNGKEKVVFCDSGFITPYNTRKIDSKNSKLLNDPKYSDDIESHPYLNPNKMPKIKKYDK